ncbi:MAG: tRNA (adenosine(37)-N6)-dimethylallyltransferase MiaA [bacterium]
MSTLSLKPPKIIAVLGTTASGKTKLAVRLAYLFNGEIVSADSRQVYQGMDIGTGKDLDDYIIKVKSPMPTGPLRRSFSEASRQEKSKVKIFEIPYYLIDVVSPKKQFNLADYQRLAYQAIDKILKKGKLPILAGGSGLYLQAAVDGWLLSKARPDRKLRQELEKKKTSWLFSFLKKLDKDFAKKVSQSDQKNKRRLIRYIEIKLVETKRLPHSFQSLAMTGGGYDTLLLGLTYPKETLNQRIDKRLEERLEQGLIEEVKRLRQQGLNWQRLEQFGLEYKFVAYYLQGKLDYEEMAEKLKTAIQQFAKRQLTWFRRWQKMGAKIHWIKSENEAKKLIKKFLKR